ncbi:hypothetical protein [Massilia sp. SYSU DXS3249]
MGTSETSQTTVDSPVALAQRETQQKLGRCLLRLQQYERLLKGLVATMSIEGHPEKLEEVLAGQVAAEQKKTLGQLIRSFTDEYIIAGQPIDESTTTSKQPDIASDVPFFHMRVTQLMPPERYRRTAAALVELRDMRNDLVHHLIEQFDISTESGCLAATTYLQECYQKIDSAFLELK